MKKFKYKVIYDFNREYPGKGFPEVLNELGSQGWELVSTPSNNRYSNVTGIAIFKLEIIDSKD